MSNAPTPETDAARELATNKSGIHEIVRIEVARKLERERDEARAEYRRLFETWQYDCKTWKERIDFAEKERDELKQRVEKLERYW